MNAGIIAGMSEHDYHSSPALSSTGVRQLLESPAKFRYAQTHPQAPRTEFDIGSAVHSKVLGTGYDITVLDYDDFRSKAAQAERDFVREMGGIPILKAQALVVNAMAEAALAHPTARAMLEQDGGTPEASVFATDPETGVNMRARFDYYAPVTVDLKTTIDASPNGFAKSIANYGYDTQRAWYLDVLRFATGEERELVFVAVEKEPPYLVAVHQLPTIWAEMGTEKARAGRRLYAECVASGEWPGYGTDVHMPSPPTWLLFEHELKYESGEIQV